MVTFGHATFVLVTNVTTLERQCLSHLLIIKVHWLSGIWHIDLIHTEKPRYNCHYDICPWHICSNNKLSPSKSIVYISSTFHPILTNFCQTPLQLQLNLSSSWLCCLCHKKEEEGRIPHLASTRGRTLNVWNLVTVLWVSGGCLAGDWWVSRGCLEVVWRMSGDWRYLADVRN